MSDARQLFEELLEAVLAVVPKTVYGDLRRVKVLVWALVGVCLMQTVRLEAWAEVVESRAQYAASRVRRFARFLHHPGIDPQAWYRPLIGSLLANWSKQERLFVALDITALTPFMLVRASLIYQGRALPLGWRVLRHASTMVSFEEYQQVLEQVRVLVPEDLEVVLLADRGFAHEQLLGYCRRVGWHVRVRLTGTIVMQRPGQPACQLRQVCPPVGHAHFYGRVKLFTEGEETAYLALACPEEASDDPWYVASDEPTDSQTLEEYALRFDIEESFLDEKSGGFQLQQTELESAQAIERLLLVIAIATLHLTSVGQAVQRAEKRRWVDTHWDRGLSSLKIGWRWVRQQSRRGWERFAGFGLAATAKGERVLASRRRSLVVRQWQVSLRC